MLLTKLITLIYFAYSKLVSKDLATFTGSRTAAASPAVKHTVIEKKDIRKQFRAVYLNTLTYTCRYI